MKLVLSLVLCLLGAEFCSGTCCPYRTDSCPKVTSSTCCPASSKCRKKVVKTVRMVRYPVGKTESSASLRNELARIHEVQMRILRSKNPKEIERLNTKAGGMAQRISEKYSRTILIPGLEHMDDVTKTLDYARKQRGPADKTPPEELLRDLHRQQLECCRFCRKKN